MSPALMKHSVRGETDKWTAAKDAGCWGRAGWSTAHLATRPTRGVNGAWSLSAHCAPAFF